MRKYPNVLLTKKAVILDKRKSKLKVNILRRYWRYFSLRLSRLQDNPQSIARGLALGVFTGCFPFFGVQTILAILLAILFKGNKIAAAAATWISNPLTSVPIFAFNFHIGKLILGGEEMDFTQLKFKSLSEVIDLGGNFAINLLLGSLIIGSITSFCTYFLSLFLLKNMRNKK